MSVGAASAWASPRVITTTTAERIFSSLRWGGISSIETRLEGPGSCDCGRGTGSGWSAGAAFLDYDRDGHLDLFVSRYLDWDLDKSKWCGDGEGTPRSYCHPREFGKVSHLLYRNLGKGTFEDVTERTGIGRKPGKGLGVKIEDLNHDGWPDVLVANDSVAQQLFLNRAGERFDEVALASGMAYDEDGSAYAGMGIDAADVDGDNQPDVFINALARQGYWLYKRRSAKRGLNRRARRQD